MRTKEGMKDVEGAILSRLRVVSGGWRFSVLVSCVAFELAGLARRACPKQVASTGRQDQVIHRFCGRIALLSHCIESSAAIVDVHAGHTHSIAIIP